ncbi:MAG: carboxymuconolactone decarboxylase family protein [Burkholderiaceae bacterium]
MSENRIAPAEAPFEPAIAQAFARIMPPGREPLALFRTMARNPRVLQRMFAGSLLDQGTLALRERELVILRTCARCGSEYEWGVHVSFFAERAGLDTRIIEATCAIPAEPDELDTRDALLFALVDELHDHADLSAATWDALAAHFSAEHILELIALTGYYHTIAFLTNGLRITPEPYAARFPAVHSSGGPSSAVVRRKLPMCT